MTSWTVRSSESISFFSQILPPIHSHPGKCFSCPYHHLHFLSSLLSKSLIHKTDILEWRGKINPIKFDFPSSSQILPSLYTLPLSSIFIYHGPMTAVPYGHGSHLLYSSFPPPPPHPFPHTSKPFIQPHIPSPIYHTTQTLHHSTLHPTTLWGAQSLLRTPERGASQTVILSIFVKRLLVSKGCLW